MVVKVPRDLRRMSLLLVRWEMTSVSLSTADEMAVRVRTGEMRRRRTKAAVVWVKEVDLEMRKVWTLAVLGFLVVMGMGLKFGFSFWKIGCLGFMRKELK